MPVQHIIVDNASNSIDWLTPVATVVAVFVGGIINYVVQSRLSDRRWKSERDARGRERFEDQTLRQQERSADFKAQELQRVDDGSGRAHEREQDEALRTRIREAEERAAALVMQSDLSMVALSAKAVWEDGWWTHLHSFDLPHWDELQLTLARSERLTLIEWQILARAVTQSKTLEAGLQKIVGSASVPPTKVPLKADEHRAPMGAMWWNASIAHIVLCKLTGADITLKLLHRDKLAVAPPEPPFEIPASIRGDN